MTAAAAAAVGKKKSPPAKLLLRVLLLSHTRTRRYAFVGIPGRSWPTLRIQKLPRRLPACSSVVPFSLPAAAERESDFFFSLSPAQPRRGFRFPSCRERALLAVPPCFLPGTHASRRRGSGCRGHHQTKIGGTPLLHTRPITDHGGTITSTISEELRRRGVAEYQPWVPEDPEDCLSSHRGNLSQYQIVVALVCVVDLCRGWGSRQAPQQAHTAHPARAGKTDNVRGAPPPTSPSSAPQHRRSREGMRGSAAAFPHDFLREFLEVGPGRRWRTRASSLLHLPSTRCRSSELSDPKIGRLPRFTCWDDPSMIAVTNSRQD